MAANSPITANADARRGDKGRPVVEQNECAARDGAQEDRQERGRLDRAVARDQFVVGQVLGKNSVFEGAQHRGLSAETEEQREKRGLILGDERNRRAKHQNQLGPFGDEDHARLGEAVRDLSGDRREQYERCDDQRARESSQTRSASAELEQREHDERVLDHVVVERAAGLRETQRAEPAGLEQFE